MSEPKTKHHEIEEFINKFEPETLSKRTPLKCAFPACCCECLRFSDREQRGVFRCSRRIMPPTLKMSCAYFELFNQERWENAERWAETMRNNPPRYILAGTEDTK